MNLLSDLTSWMDVVTAPASLFLPGFIAVADRNLFCLALVWTMQRVVQCNHHPAFIAENFYCFNTGNGGIIFAVVWCHALLQQGWPEAWGWSPHRWLIPCTIQCTTATAAGCLNWDCPSSSRLCLQRCWSLCLLRWPHWAIEWAIFQPSRCCP